MILWITVATTTLDSDIWGFEEIKPERQKYMRGSLMGWQIYKSERFVVSGNIGWRIVITDKNEDKSYEIEYTDMIKFRRHWSKLKTESQDNFLIAFISARTGKQSKKVA